MPSALPDQAARQAALDVGRSFIVQAPAGSGKTELLTLRYLKLLAVSRQPEEVLAITFTRKAASEMRDRIIKVLNWCQDCIDGHDAPENEIENLRLEIGRTVLEADKQQQWRLLQSPSRFRVQTIDSFCFYLAKQLPILSQVGGNPNVTEHIEHCFREAINATLARLESDSELAAHIETVLGHLDNDIAAIEAQLINLLKQRDQWSEHILAIAGASQSAERYLKASLEEMVAESLQSVREQLAADESELVDLMNFAASNLEAEGKPPLPDYVPLDALPPAHSDALPYWHLLTNILLTKPQDRTQTAWMQKPNKNHGFPGQTKGDKEFSALCENNKERRQALVNKYATNPDIFEALVYIRLLPDPESDSRQWRFLSALCHLLHALNGELLLAFSRFRLVDYTQTGAAARLALGSAEEPTDLALALDNVINHILVDEFQDTSELQLTLLKQLTAGWIPDDGRSLFVVGDAMQSCYGFRNANVGIYLSVQQNGIGELSLTTLTLSSNFRSQEPVVSWVNEIFAGAFPRQANISRGAVPYSRADVIHEQSDGVGVSVRLLHHEREQRQQANLAEAETVAQQASLLQQQFPDDSIAILVRTRSQLQDIVPALRARGLQWRASDIDRLAALPVIEDLLSLVRVILNPGDQLGWLSLLRAPWCGLTSSDLLALAEDESAEILWEAIQNARDNSKLSSQGQQALAVFARILSFVMASRGKRSLRQSIEAAWGLLRGINCCRTELELDSVARFLDLLDEQEVAGGLNNFFDFQDTVYAAFVPSSDTQAAATGLNLLTMHASKGLEYDHVLLPGLARNARPDDKSLLVWHHRLNNAQESRLFLAGVTETGSEESPLYQLIRYENKYKQQLESTRLLYIAVTRARKSATLFANVIRDEDGSFREPANGSLLKRIWQQLDAHASVQAMALEDYSDVVELAESGIEASSRTEATMISRFNKPVQLEPWELVAVTAPEVENATVALNSLEIGTQQAQLNSPIQHRAKVPVSRGQDMSHTDLPSILGTLVHRVFETYVKVADKISFQDQLAKLEPHWRLAIRHLDLPNATETEAIAFIRASVERTLNEPSLRWVFDDQHRDSQCELELSRFQAGYLKNFVIDRTFIDAEGVRWIIDYKTSTPAASQSADEFIADQCDSYRAQLENYRSLFQSMESNPIRTGLLLTAIPALVELNP